MWRNDIKYKRLKSLGIVTLVVLAGLLVLPLTAYRAKAQSGNGGTVYGTPSWQSGYGGNDTIYLTEAISNLLGGATLTSFAQSKYMLLPMIASKKADFSTGVLKPFGDLTANGTLGGVMNTGTSNFYEYFNPTSQQGYPDGMLVVLLPNTVDVGVLANANVTNEGISTTLTTSLVDSAPAYIEFTNLNGGKVNASALNITGAYSTQWDPSIASAVFQ